MKTLFFIISSFLFFGCDKESTPTALSVSPDTSSAQQRFITVDYIELSAIERISKFRSGIGHDYRDEAESCRSMKHYYQPKSSENWSTVKIFSPVSGTIVRREEEWAGTQLWIRPFNYSEYTIIIFHISLQKQLALNDTVTAGSQLGTHIGSQTMSDIAVAYAPQNTWKLISYFEVITDSLFQLYQVRGVASRSDLIITKASRDADPLHCSGEQFGTSGTLQNWFDLQ